MNTPDEADARLQDLWTAYRAAPDAYETNRDLGLYLAGTERYKLAAHPLLIKALSYGRRDNPTRYMFDCLGNICNLTGMYDQAAAVYAEARRLFPLTHDFALRLGDAQFRLGETEKAIGNYARVVVALYNWARELSEKTDRKQLHVLGPSRAICAAIGELAARPDMYLKARMLGFVDDADAILVAPMEEVANAALLDCWRDHITIIADPAEVSASAKKYEKNMIYLDYLPLPDGRILRRDLAHLAVQRQWEAEGRPPLLSLGQAARARGWAALAAHGVPEGAWFACLHVREPGYYGETAAWNRNRHRNADIATYGPAIEAVTGRGGWVVRIGDPTMTPLPARPQFVDLAPIWPKDEALDVFCIAEARFLVATTSGPHNVADAFGTPIVGTNWFCLGFWPLSAHDLFIHKLLRDRGSGRTLTLAEALTPPLFGAWEPMLYERLGVEVVDNAPEDIVAAVEEMLDRLDGRAAETDAEARRQQAFRTLADPHRLGLSARAGRAFLRRHAELLEAAPGGGGARDTGTH